MGRNESTAVRIDFCSMSGVNWLARQHGPIAILDVGRGRWMRDVALIDEELGICQTARIEGGRLIEENHRGRFKIVAEDPRGLVD